MNIRTFNIEEFRNFIRNRKRNTINLNKNDFRFFSWDDLNFFDYEDEYFKTLRFSLVYDDLNIYAISKSAKFPYDEKYSISYLSVHKEFRNLGYSKLLLEEICNNYVNEFSHWELGISKYTVSGWKYIRPYLLKLVKLMNINFKDSYVDYQDVKNNKEEFFKLRKISINKFKLNYPEEASVL